MKNNREKIFTICLIILATVAVTGALIYTRSIMIPFVISLFIYFIIAPLIDWLTRRVRLPRSAALSITIVSFLVMAGLIVMFISYSIGDFSEGITRYGARIEQFTGSLLAIEERFGINPEDVSLSGYLKDIPYLTVLKNVTAATVTIIGNTLLIIVFVIFLLVGERSSDRGNKLLDEIQANISHYARIKLILSVASGIYVSVVLTIFGVELAFLLGMLAFLLNFIPTAGAIVGMVLPMPVIILQYGFDWRLALIVGLLALFNIAIGNVLEPKLMGSRMDLHPIVILMSLLFWGLVWGIMGALLAVPITSVLRIVLSKFDETRPIAELLSGRI